MSFAETGFYIVPSKVIEGKFANTFYWTKGITINGKDYHFKISCTIILDLMISLHLSIFGKTACQKIQYGGAKTRISQAWMEEVGCLIPSSCMAANLKFFVCI